MFEKVKNLRDQFAQTADPNEQERIQNQLNALKEQDPRAWADAMLLCMKESNQRASSLLVRTHLAEILPMISVSFLAKNYFKKSPQWFYQRLNGNLVNGKPAQFSADELATLEVALSDIAKKLTAIRF